MSKNLYYVNMIKEINLQDIVFYTLMMLNIGIVSLFNKTIKAAIRQPLLKMRFNLFCCLLCRLT
jgi:hypothetical protein